MRTFLVALTMSATAATAVGGGLLSNPAAVGDTGTSTTITVDGTRAGAVHDGVGAISGGGGNSRLLIDYPEPQRSRILDWLFKPHYGASLQMLKLEIGGDSNSSDGAEPSVESQRGKVDCGSGYNWWLAKEAVQRNPNIKLYGLQWGAPGWVNKDTTPAAPPQLTSTGEVATRSDGLWTQADIDYTLHWLDCSRQHGLDVQYLGGWNERFDPLRDDTGVAWFKRMRSALDSHGYQDVHLVSADAIGDTKWDTAEKMTSDPDFRRAVGVIGVHDNCGFPPGPDGDKVPFGFQCSGSSAARKLDKPLWASELGKMDATKNAPTMLRQLLNSYNQATITGVLEWPLMTSMPDNLPMQNRGLVTAKWPWSGQYTVNKIGWSVAHVTQFVPMGWRHVNGANRALGRSGSFNTWESPDHKQWSMVAQNTGAYRGQDVPTQTMKVRLTGGLDRGPIQVWTTNMWSRDPAAWFVHRSDVTPRNGEFTYKVPPGQVVSFTSREVPIQKGDASSTAPKGFSPQPMPKPYTAKPDLANMPRFLAPVDGSFLYEPCQGGRQGSCIQQQALQEPVYWMAPKSEGMRHPFALVGEKSWADYGVSTDVLFTRQNSTAGVISRFGGGCGLWAKDCGLADSQKFNAYEFTLNDAGRWKVYRNTTATGRVLLKEGSMQQAPGIGSWHGLRLQSVGSTLTASIDGKTVAKLQDTAHARGLAGIESSWDGVQFDNLTAGSNPA